MRGGKKLPGSLANAERIHALLVRAVRRGDHPPLCGPHRQSRHQTQSGLSSEEDMEPLLRKNEKVPEVWIEFSFKRQRMEGNSIKARRLLVCAKGISDLLN